MPNLSSLPNQNEYTSVMEFPVSLGETDIIEIYAFYDIPVLFLCESMTHNALYIATAADEDETHETWLFLKISRPQLAQLKSNEIDLYTAFKENQEHQLIQFNQHRKEPLKSTETLIKDNSISDHLIPIPNTYLTN